MNRHNPVSGGYAGFLFTAPVGSRPVLDNPENLGSQVMERLSANHGEVKTILGKVEKRQGQVDATIGEVKAKIGEFDNRLTDVEQKAARRGGPVTPIVASWGQRFVESEATRALTVPATARDSASTQSCRPRRPNIRTSPACRARALR